MNNSWYDIYIYLHLVSNMKYDLKYDIYTYCSWVYPLTHFRVNTIMWIMLFFVHEYPMHLDWDCDAPSAWFILYDIALCQFTLFYFTFISYCILATIYIYDIEAFIWHLISHTPVLILDTIQMCFKRRSHSSSNFRWLRHQVLVPKWELRTWAMAKFLWNIIFGLFFYVTFHSNMFGSVQVCCMSLVCFDITATGAWHDWCNFFFATFLALRGFYATTS